MTISYRLEDKKVGSKRHIFTTFADWSDFIDTAEHVAQHDDGDMHYTGGDSSDLRCASLDPDRDEWSGRVTLAEAISLARKGWPEGREQIRQLRGSFSVEQLFTNTRVIEPVYDVTGDEPDIGRHIDGVPESMLTLTRTTGTGAGKVIRLGINMGHCADVPAERVLARGKLLVSLIHLLTLLGYSPDITLIGCTQASGAGPGYHFEYVPLLHASQPLNLDTLVFALAHPAVLRKLVFAVQETLPCDIRKLQGYHKGSGYGRSDRYDDWATVYPQLDYIFETLTSDKRPYTDETEHITILKDILADLHINAERLAW